MALPFDHGEFAWVVGRHMLYHVSDIQRALAEFARVATSRVLVSTNGRRNLPRVSDLIDDLLIAFGYAPVQMPSERFCIENADEIFQGAGLESESTITSNALVFHDVEPIMRYVMSSVPSFEISDEQTLRAMERWIRPEAQRRLDDLGGTWRDPTRAGLYILTGR